MNSYYKDSWNNKAQNKVVFIIFSVWLFSGFLLLVPLLSPQIENLYFPNDDPRISILAVYGTLSLSLLARVFGGLYFGRLADIHGRRPVILLSLFSLSLTMIVSAYLPSVKLTPLLPYTVLSFLFVLTRIIIGFFVGGLWPTAAVFGMEKIYAIGKDYDYKFKLPVSEKLDIHTFKESLRHFRQDQEDFRKQTMKRTVRSSLMQVGFFTGYLLSVILVSFLKGQLNAVLHIFFLFPPMYYTDYGIWRSMSFFGGILGSILFVVSWKYLTESEEWQKWKELWRQQKKLENPERLALKSGEKIDAGISTLLENSKYKQRLIGFWLILSGLMYMYYSTVVMVPELLERDPKLLERDNVSNNFSTVILVATALPAHIILGVFLHWAWERKKWHTSICDFSGYFNKLIIHTRNQISRLFGFTDNNEILQDDKFTEDLDIELDIVSIRVLGLVLVFIGIIGSVIFILVPLNKVVYFTALAILVANSGWAIVPSMLSSRFPTQLRSTGASLVYNGGLAISFASPFIIMEFYLRFKSEYIVFVAMILGAASMIVGASRLMRPITKKSAK